ncbi:hypothetical protein CMV_010073 [Castanea mollissima]|uniref:Uncharacterized protein n=1 Tax=Castanea mollissima TaxID=60419 RepID=A0A8J4R8Y6_9ROSI|nr:hypothetical protein CMV_010073 [Castanea mollissima]
MARYYNQHHYYLDYVSFPVHLCFFVFILFFILGFTCGVPSLIPLPGERDSLHRAGGSPWGVALVLVFLLFMISHQSSFHERWFPLLNR